MVENKEEFGYPHEIISSSIKWAHKALEGNYRRRTKVLAYLLLSTIEKAPKQKIEIAEKDDINNTILYSVAKKNKLKFVSVLPKKQERLIELIEKYKERQSLPALRDLEDFIAETIFIHIVLKEATGKILLKKEVIENLLTNVTIDASLKAILESIKLLDGKTELDESKVSELIKSLHAIDRFPSRLYSMFITFYLAIKYGKFKSKFLFEHYWALRETVGEFSNLSDEKRLDDSVLERLFKAAVILHNCGYEKSLRLPHEEKINYFEHVLSVNTIANEFKKAFARHAVFDLRFVKIPLWFAAIIDAILIALGAFWQVYASGGLNLLFLTLDFPFSVPIFPILAFILTILIVFKIYKLKDHIGSDLRKGG